MNKFKRVLSYLARLMRRNPPPRDPFAWKPAPLKPRPKRPGSAAVALAEPDDE